MKAHLLLLIALSLCASCTTTVAVRKAPTIDLRRFHRLFVEQPFNENHHLDEIMAEELRKLGYEASSGPLTMMPENTEAVVSYHAQWAGDFFIYLIDLNVSVYTAHTNKPLGEGRYYQPTVRTKTPEKVVHELFPRLFAK
jgi:hypothetical protein